MDEILKKLDPKNDKQFGTLAIVAVAALAIKGVVELVK